MIELGGGGEAASCGSSQCTQETDEHIRCGCGSALRTRQNGLAALISEGNAYALLTPSTISMWVQYAPLHSWQAITHMSCISQQVVMTVT